MLGVLQAGNTSCQNDDVIIDLKLINYELEDALHSLDNFVSNCRKIVGLGDLLSCAHHDDDLHSTRIIDNMPK